MLHENDRATTVWPSRNKTANNWKIGNYFLCVKNVKNLNVITKFLFPNA